VKVGDSSYSFLVVLPQYSQRPYVLEVAAVIGHVLATYRVDSSRIYLAGLSMGARIASLVGARYPSGFAAMVPIAGISDNDELMNSCDSMAHTNLPVWALHNLDDPLSDVNIVRNFIDSLAIRSPDPLPKLTVFDAYGHDAWTTALDPAFRENGLNIYEWMLQYSR
jgi:predicted peptidase